MHASWLIPDWPAPSNVRAVFTTRQGGLSAAPWDSLNLGDHVGDDPGHVHANRAALQLAAGMRAVFLRQIHGNAVLALDAASQDNAKADACFTKQPELACTIMVADCLPVLLTTTDGIAVAAAHAGWRGLAGSAAQGYNGVLEALFASFSASFSVVAQQVRAQPAIKTIAWLGPCIGPKAFEVGAEVKAAFEAGQPGAAQFFVPMAAGKYLADLAGLARRRLHALGITDVYGNDGSAPWCTVGNPEKFFSHRRDASGTRSGFNTTGRMAACIWRV